MVGSKVPASWFHPILRFVSVLLNERRNIMNSPRRKMALDSPQLKEITMHGVMRGILDS